MKKLLLVFLVALAMLVPMVSVYAAEESSEDYSIQVDRTSYDRTPVNKFSRGVVNTATCWAEVPAAVFDVSKHSNPVVGCTLGFAEGLVTGTLRALTGIFDTVTFIIPPYDKPIMKPEYALTSADNKLKDYLW